MVTEWQPLSAKLVDSGFGLPDEDFLMSLPTPRFEAFLLRFVRDVPTSQWRGVIVHVQSNTEKSFTHFADALAFIKHDVTGGGFIFKGGNDAEGKSEWD